MTSVRDFEKAMVNILPLPTWHSFHRIETYREDVYKLAVKHPD